VAIVGRPPVLRIGHQRAQVFLDGRQVEAEERLAVIEIRVHRIGLRRVLAQDAEVDALGPPVAVGLDCAGDGGAVQRTLRFIGHEYSFV
jgi:hypothetical protein